MTLTRRRLLETGFAVAGLVTVAGCTESNSDGANSTESNGETGGGDTPPLGGWLDNVSNYSEVIDETEADEVSITVGSTGNGGSFAFDPPAVEISPGTTVVWRWSGNGGSHNVVGKDDTFSSKLVATAGHTFDYTFEKSGTYKYYCEPHKTLGMKGVVIVG